MRCLFVDNEPYVCTWIARDLARRGVDVDWASEPDDLWRELRSGAHDVVVLDERLDWRDSPERGSWVCARQRCRGDRRPFALTSHVESYLDGVVLARECGADAFAIKQPAEIFAELELLSKIDRARPPPPPRCAPPRIYRRSPGAQEIEMDAAGRRVIARKVVIPLTPLEYATFHYLLEHTGRVVTMEDLRRDVWRRAIERSAVSNVVGRLIARFPGWIVRVRGGVVASVEVVGPRSARE